jgi:predicted transposase YbfD/YdcC
VVQSVIAVADRGAVAPAVPGAATEIADDLLKLFGSVSDGRSGQGRDHPVAAVLALAAAAVVAGMKGYTAIAGWVKDVPPPVLTDLYLRAGAAPAAPPSRATIWRVITDADAEAFDATVGSWLMGSLAGEPAGQRSAAGTGQDDPAGLVPVRLDGKTVRGARDAAGNQRHLLAALAGRTAQTSVIAAQAEVGVKTNESLHWLRDTLYQEDKSQVRTRSGPRVMAALRNLAICALRLFGRTDVTEATRWASRSMDRPFAILGLTS